MTTFLKLFSSIVFLLAATACYRMPGPDDYSMIPSTNNSDFTRAANDQTPGLGY